MLNIFRKKKRSFDDEFVYNLMDKLEVIIQENERLKMKIHDVRIRDTFEEKTVIDGDMAIGPWILKYR